MWPLDGQRFRKAGTSERHHISASREHSKYDQTRENGRTQRRGGGTEPDCGGGGGSGSGSGTFHPLLDRGEWLDIGHGAVRRPRTPALELGVDEGLEHGGPVTMTSARCDASVTDQGRGLGKGKGGRVNGVLLLVKILNKRRTKRGDYSTVMAGVACHLSVRWLLLLPMSWKRG